MSRPELYVVSGEIAGRRFSVTDGGLRLGRSSSNDIHVPDEELSRNHCLFESVGADGLQVTDLASANGTFVNGSELGSDPRTLAVGDRIEVGSLVLQVVAEGETPAGSRGGIVDLGLGDVRGGSAADAPAAVGVPVRRRSPFMNVVWALVVIVLGVAIYLVLCGPRLDEEGEAAPIGEVDGELDVVEMAYEKVSADAKSIFRYSMSYTADGTLKVVIDDVPGENRHVVKSARLTVQAIDRLREILRDPEIAALDREYGGDDLSTDELKSWTLKIVYTTSVKRISVVNAAEPDAFCRVREKLEAFSKNELGIWALQYSREKLFELAKASAEVGRVKWEDREVEYGNLAASIAAYREAMFYLDTLTPKPDEYFEYRDAKDFAEKELEARYRDQRFKADRAINLQDWETARTELQVLIALVPNRDDDRYREANAKLVDVEKRLTDGGRR